MRRRPPADLRSPALRYGLAVAGAAIAILALVAAIDVILDPFGMFGIVALDGVNAYKPAIHTRVRLYKAYAVARVRPRTIVLGSSRTHVGIRCSHPALQALPGPCYNLAFDGATTREMYAYLVHAQTLRPLSAVVLGLDTYHLGTAPSAVRPDFDPEVLLGPGHGRLRRFVAGDLRIATSYATLAAGIEAWRRQDDGEPEWFAPDGQRLGEVFFHRAGEDYVVAGPRAYFDAIDRLEVGFQTEGVAARPSAPGVAAPAPDPDASSIGYVRRIVAFCRAHGIRLWIFVTPAHVHQIEITAASGGWPALEQGKRALAQLLADDAARHPDAPPIAAWDFSGYSSVTEEALPPVGSHAEMRYYWESSHFKAIVGDYVLDRLFGADDGNAAPPDFGVRVKAATIDRVLADQRERQASYRATHAAEIATLQSLVAEARAAHRPTAGP